MTNYRQAEERKKWLQFGGLLLVLAYFLYHPNSAGGGYTEEYMQRQGERDSNLKRGDEEDMKRSRPGGPQSVSSQPAPPRPVVRPQPVERKPQVVTISGVITMVEPNSFAVQSGGSTTVFGYPADGTFDRTLLTRGRRVRVQGVFGSAAQSIQPL